MPLLTIREAELTDLQVAIANLSPNFPKRDVLRRKCWESPIVQSNLKMQYKWFFDGKKLAWYVRIPPLVSRETC